MCILLKDLLSFLKPIPTSVSKYWANSGALDLETYTTTENLHISTGSHTFDSDSINNLAILKEPYLLTRGQAILIIFIQYVKCLNKFPRGKWVEWCGCWARGGWAQLWRSWRIQAKRDQGLSTGRIWWAWYGRPKPYTGTPYIVSLHLVYVQNASFPRHARVRTKVSLGTAFSGPGKTFFSVLTCVWLSQTDQRFCERKGINGDCDVKILSLV